MNLDTLIPVSPRKGSGFRDSSKPFDLIYARRILVAEDDEIIRRIISNALADDGYVVNAAADGEQAWEALRHDSYDLLVTDNDMPRLTGLKLIERIRQAGMGLPVIVASGTFTVERVLDYPQLQIAAVIPKPFQKLEFLDTVRNVLSSNEDPKAKRHRSQRAGFTYCHQKGKKLNQLNQPEDSTMKALIIYDDFNSAVEASTTLQRSARKADFAVQWNIRPWRVDMLKFPPTADEALTEALDAHLIVFAGRSAQSLPFWLERWLEQWAKYRRIKDAALAVVSAGSSKALSSASAEPDLSQFARRHDLSVIFNGKITGIPSSIEDRSSCVEGRLHERELSMSPFLPQTLDPKTRDSYRGWSITGLPSRS